LLPAVNFMLNIIIPNKLRMVKKLFTKGSSTLLRAHGRVGASATTLSFLSAPPSEKSAGGFQQAGKKEGGWGEGIFARLLPFPFRLSKSELVEQWRGWLPWSVLFSRFAQRRFAHFQTKGTILVHLVYPSWNTIETTVLRWKDVFETFPPMPAQAYQPSLSPA